MKKCLNCYREVDDDRHVICPDCGYVLHKGDEMSSEDADDGRFAPMSMHQHIIDKLQAKIDDVKDTPSDYISVPKPDLLALLTNCHALAVKFWGNDANNSPKA